MTKKEEVKQIKKLTPKSCIILGVVYLVCISLTLYLCKWYEVYKEYEKEIPVIRGSLMEITSNDLDHYVVDASSTIIYMCTSADETCRSFEKSFKKYIQREEITDEITYLNLSNTDLEEFVNEFNKTYSSKVKLNGHYPAFVVIQDGKVVSILQGNKKESLTISKVKNFLELYLQKENEISIEEE